MMVNDNPNYLKKYNNPEAPKVGTTQYNIFNHKAVPSSFEPSILQQMFYDRQGRGENQFLSCNM